MNTVGVEEYAITADGGLVRDTSGTPQILPSPGSKRRFNCERVYNVGLVGC